MPYASYVPHPSLRPFVECIWVQESETDASSHPFPATRVLPAGTVDVAFYFRDAFYQEHGLGRTVLPLAVVTGPQTGPCQYGALGRTGIMLVRLRPGAAATLLSTPTRELRDANIDLELVLSPARVREIQNRIQGAPDARTRVAILERFLLETVRPTSHPMRVLQWVQQIYAKGGRQSVREISQSLHVGPRQLERLFQEYVGLSPKTFSRIVRFQAAIERRSRGLPWAMVAYEGGYQDQSHLCNDFMRLAGLSPESLLVQTKSTSLAKFFNRRREMSPSCNTVYA